jgi:hypothetical protein
MAIGRRERRPQPQEGNATIPAGRFAVLADTQGAVFCLFEGEVDD